MELRDRADHLRRHLRDIFPEGGLEGLSEGLEADLPDFVHRRMAPEEVEKGRRGLSKLAREPEALDPGELGCAEAIIELSGRPAVDVVGGSYHVEAPLWAHLNEQDTRERIQARFASICRVELPGHPTVPFGGTAFVVAPDLVMTNRHVARLFCEGLGRRGLVLHPDQAVGVDFLQERGGTESAFVDVTEVAMIHPHWDMALLRVEGLEPHRPALPLEVVEPEEIQGEDLVVVGYPAFDARSDPQVQNTIFQGIYNVKRLLPGRGRGRRPLRRLRPMAHDASTLGGCSGSAILRVRTGKVVGLHFAGRYRVTNWAVPTCELARDPRVQEAGLAFDGIPAPGLPDWMGSWNIADPPEPVAITPGGLAPPVDRSAPSAPRTVELTVPLHLTVSLGAPHRGADPAPRIEVRDASEAPPPPRPPHPPRPPEDAGGYRPDFLGEDLEVPLPRLSPEQRMDVAWNRHATRDRHLLPYHRFCVAMCRSRRLAWYAAANLEGGSARRSPPPSDDPSAGAGRRGPWHPDPRIAPWEQHDHTVYEGNALEPGPLVQPQFLAWGSDPAEAMAARDDAFHWTNGCPQPRALRRQPGLWAHLERHLLRASPEVRGRLCVFAGPVYREDDGRYPTRDGNPIQVPRSCWKVITRLGDEGRLTSTGYLLTRQNALAGLPEYGQDHRFEVHETFQVSLRRLQELTGLSFGALVRMDPLEPEGAGRAGAGGPGRRLRAPRDIVLRPSS